MKRKIVNALISVSDKSGLDKITKVLKKYNINIISSGGTFKYLKRRKLNVEKYLTIPNLRKCLMEELKLCILKFTLEYYLIGQRKNILNK